MPYYDNKTVQRISRFSRRVGMGRMAECPSHIKSLCSYSRTHKKEQIKNPLLYTFSEPEMCTAGQRVFSPVFSSCSKREQKSEEGRVAKRKGVSQRVESEIMRAAKKRFYFTPLFQLPSQLSAILN